jgi:hypothetical protein
MKNTRPALPGCSDEASQAELRERDLQRRIAAEDFFLAAAVDQCAQAQRQRGIEVTDSVVVDTHRREPRHAAAAHVVVLDGKRFAVALVGPRRPLQVNEVLERLRIERGELDDHAGRQEARIDRKIGAADARTAA